MATKKWKILRKIPLLILIIVLTVILQNSNSRFIFEQEPKYSAGWIIGSIYENYIGSVIKTTLRIKTEPGADLDLRYLPRPGDIWKIPTRKIETPLSGKNTSPQMYHLISEYSGSMSDEINEGQMEVRSVKISQYLRDGEMITDINFEFQYLVTLDFSAIRDGKTMPSFTMVFMNYLKRNPNTGRITREVDLIRIKEADFYITSRVIASTHPYLTHMEIASPKNLWEYSGYAGMLLVNMSFFALIWRIIGKHINRQTEMELLIEPYIDEIDLNVLFKLWEINYDYRVFLRAVIHYRTLIYDQPRTDIWNTTTFVLYGGEVLDQKRVRGIFTELLAKENENVDNS